MAVIQAASSLVLRTTGGLWRWRELWWNLAVTEINERFRRTMLGAVWVIIQPIWFTLMLCAVFGFLTQQNLVDFSNYVFAGVIFWTWFSESIIQSGQSVINGQSLLRQEPLPVVIFPLKTVLAATFNFALGFCGLLAWILVTKRSLPGAESLLLLINVPLVGIAIFPYAVCASVLGTMYRDFQQALQLLLQALWFLSPIFVDKAVFENPGLREWNVVNPVANMLALIRDPIHSGAVPPSLSYAIVILFAVVGYAFALLLLHRNERRLIFYV